MREHSHCRKFATSIVYRDTSLFVRLNFRDFWIEKQDTDGGNCTLSFWTLEFPFARISLSFYALISRPLRSRISPRSLLLLPLREFHSKGSNSAICNVDTSRCSLTYLVRLSHCQRTHSSIPTLFTCTTWLLRPSMSSTPEIRMGVNRSKHFLRTPRTSAQALSQRQPHRQ